MAWKGPFQPKPFYDVNTSSDSLIERRSAAVVLGKWEAQFTTPEFPKPLSLAAQCRRGGSAHVMPEWQPRRAAGRAGSSPHPAATFPAGTEPGPWGWRSGVALGSGWGGLAGRGDRLA